MKEILSIVGVLVIAVVIGTGAYWYINTSGMAPRAEEPQGTAVTFTELAHGIRSTEARRANYVIKSTAELTQLWKMIDTNKPQPQVDFENDVVIAVFAGEQPTVGYDIAITNIEDDGERKVSVTLTKPGGSCLVAQVLTYPFQVVKAPKTSLKYTHENLTSTTSCLQ